MNSNSIPKSKGEKNVKTLAALPTGGSAFCGALEDGMGEVLVSVKEKKKNSEHFLSNSTGFVVTWFVFLLFDGIFFSLFGHTIYNSAVPKGKTINKLL